LAKLKSQKQAFSTTNSPEKVLILNMEILVFIELNKNFR